jgi:putative oxidoreductase
MNIGILILRVALALILVAHSSQKTLGWFQGRGIVSMAGWFSDLGLRPGRHMVIIASCTEVAAAISIGFGFLSPLGAMAACGAMLVAGMTMHIDAGKLWNAGGGGEYPYLLSVVALALGFAGPGRFSVDHLLVRTFPWLGPFDSGVLVGIVVLLVAVVSAVPFALIIRRERRTATTEPAN